MTSPKKSPWSDQFAAAGRVFLIFLALGQKARRTRVFFALSFLPVAVALVLKFNQVFSPERPLDGAYMFSNIIMVFYLQLIILLLALFFGTSICSEEVEGRTLPYLVTRPVPKSAVVLGKYVAYSLLTVGMVILGLLFAFIILHLDRLADLSYYPVLLRFAGVLSLGIMAYTALFAFFGSFLKRSIFFGLLFCFGWENVIQYFPGSTQRFAIAHYLKSFLPGASSGRFSFLTFRLEATRPGMALLMLFLITAGFLALACLLFSKKEYIFED